jgi:uncharacterized protein YjbI with pentapeptide repeats
MTSQEIWTPQAVLAALKAGLPLNQADFYQFNFRGCDLQAALLSGATLIRADLSHANLRQANLQGAYLYRVD